MNSQENLQPVEKETQPCKTRHPIIRMFRLIAGWLLVGVGIIGLFLPILQGILMIAAGLALLSGESELIKRVLKKAEPYYRVVRMKWNAWRTKRKTKKIGKV